MPTSDHYDAMRISQSMQLCYLIMMKLGESCLQKDWSQPMRSPRQIQTTPFFFRSVGLFKSINLSTKEISFQQAQPGSLPSALHLSARAQKILQEIHEFSKHVYSNSLPWKMAKVTRWLPQVVFFSRLFFYWRNQPVELSPTAIEKRWCRQVDTHHFYITRKKPVEHHRAAS